MKYYFIDAASKSVGGVDVRGFTTKSVVLAHTLTTTANNPLKIRSRQMLNLPPQ
ncbi:hypothetical protein [Ferrimonas senticii]|uniref:hypothetical protein n=1 Tax=Ferrimonas senticii TaxID=394566 RepID=UPI0012EB15BE|nr:hypothetical protein [Ferrimonas senticii]